MKTVKCPHCKNETVWENNPHKPFCSKRCKDIDLGKWANEEYRVPIEEMDSGVEPVKGKKKDEAE